MAEPLSFTVAAVSLIDVCQRLVFWLRSVHNQSQRIDSDIKDLEAEVQTIRNVADSIKATELDIGPNFAPGDNVNDTDRVLTEDHWRKVHAALKDCENVLAQLESLLKSVVGKGSLEKFNKKLDGLLKALRKNSNENDYMRIRQRLSSSQNALQSCLQAISITYNHQAQKDVNLHLSKAIAYLEEIKNRTAPKLQREGSFLIIFTVPPLTREAKNNILRWLKFSDSSPIYNDSRQKHTDATGNWFIEGEFRDWISTPSSFFWLSGKAGCGKTILSSTIVKEVERQQLGTLAYFYFSFRRTENQGPRNLINSILTQLVQGLTRNDVQSPDLFHVPKAFQQLYDSTLVDSEPSIDHLKSTLLAVLNEAQSTYIIVDALDECPSRRDRSEILDFLMEISLSFSGNTHILVTSRREEDIALAIRRLSLSSAICMIPLQNPEVARDIKRHVQRCINRDYEYESWRSELKDIVIEDLSSRADGVFKWVECQLAALRSKIFEDDVLMALKELPKDLDETYARMLSHINASGYADECYAMLQWLAFSRRPLLLTEMAEAAAFVYEDMPSRWSERCVTFNPKKRFPHASAIRRLLSQLVTVTKATENSTLIRNDSNSDHGLEISFSHFSVQEYLICDRVDPLWRIEATMAHRFILECCIIYILRSFSASSDFLALDGSVYPLLHYACQFWPLHADDACSAIAESLHVNDLILRLFRDDRVRFVQTLKVVSWGQKQEENFFISDDEYASPAWYFSHKRSVYVLRLFQNEDALDPGLEMMFHGLPSLHVASGIGDEAVVTALIELGADIGALDEKQWTPLHRAAAAGHDSVVKCLLDRASSVTAMDEDEETPLHRAVRAGRQKTVQLLAHWEGGASLEMRNVYGLTPLHMALRAAEWLGSPGSAVVKTLLEAGAKLETQSWSGLTAFKEVAQYRKDATALSSLEARLKVDEPLYRPWSVLRRALSKAIWSQARSLGTATYLSAYTYVHDYCTGQEAPLESRWKNRWRHNKRGGDLLGAEMYSNVEQYLNEQMIELRAAAARMPSSELLRFYGREWTRFKLAAKHIGRICGYLNTSWVKREIDEGRRRYLVQDLCKAQWRIYFLDHEPRVAQYVLENLEAQRDGRPAKLAYVKSILLDSFAALDRLEGERIQHPHRLYREAFETPFLESSKTLYTSKAKEYLEELGVSRYLCEVEILLDGQTTRLREYVEPATMEELSNIAVSIFIVKPFTKLRDEIEQLDQTQRVESVMRAHELLGRTHLRHLALFDEKNSLKSLCEIIRDKQEQFAIVEEIRLRSKEKVETLIQSKKAIEETISQILAFFPPTSAAEEKALESSYQFLNSQIDKLVQDLSLDKKKTQQRVRSMYDEVGSKIQEGLKETDPHILREKQMSLQQYLRQLTKNLWEYVETTLEES